MDQGVTVEHLRFRGELAFITLRSVVSRYTHRIPAARGPLNAISDENVAVPIFPCTILPSNRTSWLMSAFLGYS